MNNEPLVFERIFNAPIAKLWKAITDKDDMKQWYFDLQEFKPEVGFEFQFLAGKDDIKYLHFCKITEVISEKKLTYSWRFDGMEGMSYLTFELFPEGDNTRLKLTHTGLETFVTDNPDFAKKSFTEGWTYILDKALKEFVETK